jgi:hypothetical protein
VDKDLCPLIGELAAQAEDLENLAGRFTPEGIVISGNYRTPFGVRVGFETRWELTAAGPELHARLASLTIASIPATLIRGLLLKMVSDLIEEDPGVELDEKAGILRVHLAEMLRPVGFDLEVHFSQVTLVEGGCTIEAGT